MWDIQALYHSIINPNNIFLEEEFKKFAQECLKFKLPCHFAQQHTMLLYNNGRFWCSARRESAYECIIARKYVHRRRWFARTKEFVLLSVKGNAARRRSFAGVEILVTGGDGKVVWKEVQGRLFGSRLVMSLQTIWLQLSAVFHADPNISISNFYTHRNWTRKLHISREFAFCNNFYYYIVREAHSYCFFPDQSIAPHRENVLIPSQLLNPWPSTQPKKRVTKYKTDKYLLSLSHFRKPIYGHKKLFTSDFEIYICPASESEKQRGASLLSKQRKMARRC